MAGLPVSPLMEIALVLFFIVTSAGYTAAEVAIAALLRARRQEEEAADGTAAELADAEDELSLSIGSLLDRPGILAVTFILGRVVMRVLAVTVIVLIAFRWPVLVTAFDPRWLLTVALVVAVLLLLVLTEMLPRICGMRWPERTLSLVSPLVRISGFVFLPFSLLLTGIFRRAGYARDDGAVFHTTEELRHLLEEREDAGTLEAQDREMIEDLLEFGETMAREVMVPRIDIVAVDVKDDFATVRKIVRETGHSRLPLYDGDIDHVVGIIHTKDLLRLRDGEEVPLTQLARKVSFVPETKMIDDLLREFQQTRNHMAIVVDEYGGTSGLVTLEDLIEEIVGEIQDEYDFETPMIQPIDPHRWLVDAMIGLEDFEEAIGVELPRNGYDTLGGFLYSLEGRVPEQGQKLEFENLRFVIRTTRERRILKVEVSRLPETAATDTSA